MLQFFIGWVICIQDTFECRCKSQGRRNRNLVFPVFLRCNFLRKSWKHLSYCSTALLWSILILYQHYALRAFHVKHVNISAFHFPPFNLVQLNSVFVLPAVPKKKKNFLWLSIDIKNNSALSLTLDVASDANKKVLDFLAALWFVYQGAKFYDAGFLFYCKTRRIINENNMNHKTKLEFWRNQQKSFHSIAQSSFST